jgi:multiple sugar transport system substrate-binding protein
MHDAIYTHKISQQATTSWQESDVQKTYLAGQAAFAMNWPYIFQLAQQPSSTVKDKTGWIPFPSSSGSPKAALGGDSLGVNAKSKHQAEAWKFIQFLLSDSVQQDRALSAGDPPAVKSAYNSALFSQAPYYKDEQKVFNNVASRPVNPKYPQISDVLQTQLNAALSNQVSPQAALTAAQQSINSIVGNG